MYYIYTIDLYFTVTVQTFSLYIEIVLKFYQI